MNTKIKSKFMVAYTLAWLIFLFFLAKSVPAFYGDIAHDRENFTLGVAGQNGNQVGSLTALFPLKSIGGWAGLYASRQTADGMTVSETYNAHIQGGVDVKGVGIEAYASSTRDKWRAIDLSIETGYFIRPGTFTWNANTFSGGAGNYTERRDLDDEIDRDASDQTTTFGWVSFVSAKWKNLSGVLRYKPSLDFADEKIEGSLSFNQELNDELSLSISTLSTLDSQSVTDSDVHHSYMIGIQYTPE